MNCRFSKDSKDGVYVRSTPWQEPRGKRKGELDMGWNRTLLMAVAGLAISFGTIANASADTVWQKHHPRREEVNNRLANQNRRIDTERKEGEISVAQARTLHRDDRAIRGQERFDARFDNGHVTKAEQRALNQDENGVSRQIGR
jgi:hypothetical protein